jgi:transposase
MMIGVDYHPSFQQIAFLVEETGEYSERQLNHSDGEAAKFYRDLKLRGVCVRVGMEATGYFRWFERLLAELNFDVWIGDPAEIKAMRSCDPCSAALRFALASSTVSSQR